MKCNDIKSEAIVGSQNVAPASPRSLWELQILGGTLDQLGPICVSISPLGDSGTQESLRTTALDHI